MEDKKLKQREEIPKEYKWRLEEIYADDGQWEKDFAKIKEILPRMEGFRNKLGDSPQSLLGCLRLQDEIGQISDQVFVYANMRKDENNANSKYQGMKDRAQGLMVAIGEALSFIQPEILAIDSETLNEYLNREPGLSLYQFYLEEILRMKEHTLSPREEEIIAMSGELGAGPKNIFSMLNNADIKFPEITDEEGDRVAITHGNYIKFMESEERQVRMDAFKGLYDTYGKQKNTLGALLNASVKKDIFYARVHKYGSALEASLYDDNIPVRVYDNLIKTVRSHLGLFYRYVALRKRLLGLPELHMYDIYAPLVKEMKSKIPYEEAVTMVEKGLAPLGEIYLTDLKQGIRNGWVDVMENEGKTSGAYSWGAYGTHPYVLMNYQNNLDNVFTLAHELGHSLHSYYSWQTQPYIYSYYKIFVAEVASTVNETLLTKYLLANAADEKQKMYLINHYLEEFRGTVFRQTMFAEFEKIIHEKAEAGEPLTTEAFSEIYYQLNQDYYGPDMAMDQEIALEWARIPHFYNAFYVYKYATGFSAASALAQGILEEGQPAVDRYLKFLQSGGSDYPINLLQKAGVDMNEPHPIEQALKVFEEMLVEMEKMV
ncbi:oligoendopeptidase F [Dehalobacterium formicoaceticum]|uniref:Oligopeptidase F n=1 Tax=Dehalobacterium formicoaceticum TaxID=51515 RepID=A0ABT1Y7E1_9FIRM|nr:oligoendopeptidase F [Dehalobacterium formicoaceticum]MCR6545606.1 oligoendopeptidase F [Dehalobacterium formicoaceticum]